MFPNFSKHTSKALFNPKDTIHYHKKSFVQFPKTWIIVWRSHVFNHLARTYKVKQTPIHAMAKTLIIGEAGVLLMRGIGAPHAVSVCEEIIVHGGKDFYIVGSAGGLHCDGVFLCSKSLRDEGTSHHYLKSTKYAYPDKSLTQKLGGFLQGIEYRLGASWTTDAIYRETKKEVEHYSKLGIKTVEMESSALFSLGKYRKVNFAAVFVVSDVLGENWEPKFAHKNPRQMMHTIAKLIVEKNGATRI